MKKVFLFTVSTFITLSFFSCNTDSQKSDDGWTNLFDGKTLDGWKRMAGTADYKVEDGAIVGTTVVNSGNSFLVSDKEYGDYVLELDVKIMDTTSNSGIQIRSHYDSAGHEGKGRVYGRQFTGAEILLQLGIGSVLNRAHANPRCDMLAAAKKDETRAI